MTLTLEQIKSITFGAVEITEKNSSIRFQKCTKKQIDAFTALSATLGERTKATTGVRLDFHTSSKSFSLTASSGSKFDLYIDGTLTEHYRFGNTDEAHTIAVPLTPKAGTDSTRVTLYFPSHDRPAVVNSVVLDDGATLIPHKFDRKILFIGDSITQGWNTKYDSLSYAIRLSRMLNADSVINGIGGAYFDPSTFDSIPFDPDTVIVAYGTNDFSYRSTLTSLRENTSAFLAKVAKEYSGKKIYAISPIPRGDSDTVKPMGSFSECRQVEIEEIERSGITHVDGYSLISYNPDLYADAVHPNDLGFSVIAEKLVELIL